MPTCTFFSTMNVRIKVALHVFSCCQSVKLQHVSHRSRGLGMCARVRVPANPSF